MGMCGMKPRGLTLTCFKGSETPDIGPWEESSWGPRANCRREGAGQQSGVTGITEFLPAACSVRGRQDISSHPWTPTALFSHGFDPLTNCRTQGRRHYLLFIMLSSMVATSLRWLLEFNDT